MTNGSSHSRWESNVHACEEAVTSRPSWHRSMTRAAGGSVWRTTPKSIRTAWPTSGDARRASPRRCARRRRSRCAARPRASPRSRRVTAAGRTGEEHHRRESGGRPRSSRAAGRSGSGRRPRRRRPRPPARAIATSSGWNGAGVAPNTRRSALPWQSNAAAASSQALRQSVEHRRQGCRRRGTRMSSIISQGSPRRP